jgi:site-specific DNA recombinase
LAQAPSSICGGGLCLAAILDMTSAAPSFDDIAPISDELTEYDRAHIKLYMRLLDAATLLTGIAVCEKCGRGMMLRTGKGGQYRYLTCAKRATEGTGCGHSIRMDKVDELVIKAMEDHVFMPERLTAILETMTDRTDDTRQQLEAEIDRQRIAVGEAQARLDRLYDAIEAGVAELNDPKFKERVDLAKLQIREGTVNLASLRQRRGAKAELSPAMVRRFSSGIRRRLRDTDPSFRRTWLHMFVSKVTIGRHQIRICGPKDQLLKAVSEGEDSARAMVPTFAREWRTRHDSNVWPLPSEGSALSS